MKYTNQENEISIEVSAKLVEFRKGFPFDKRDESYHGHFKITLQTGSGSETFDYYGSAHDREIGKKELSDDDLKGALRCIVDDALYGEMDFDEFCGEMGYDEDSRNAEQIHKACIKTGEHLSGIGISGDTLYTIVNDLNEY